MKKIRVLLYKAKWGDKSIIDNLISIWTRSKYSHIEIWTPDSVGVFECGRDFNGCGVFLGSCWTSTMQDDHDGTVTRLSCNVLKYPDRWDYIELQVDDTRYDDMIEYMNKEVANNKGYSKWDILKFFTPIHFPDNKRNICSEFVNNALVVAVILKDKGIVSPKKVWQKLSKLGYTTRQL